MLEKVDLTQSLNKKTYKEKLSGINDRLTLAQRACWDTGIPVVIIFESWDGGGKGDAINLLAQNMDPRGFKNHTIRKPTPGEEQMPWLWRLWLRIPNYGEVAIFDRSWYWRITVERVEKTHQAKVWRQAFQDINDLERTLTDDGYVLIKFFLHISKDEQHKRFKKLEKDPLKSWRVTKEDWQHHKKYDEYMLAMTETEWGSWTIVEANDPQWANYKVLDTVLKRLEDALHMRNIDLPQIGTKVGQVEEVQNA
jgi:polyphosphate kinase 2 (PPK2 family)